VSGVDPIFERAFDLAASLAIIILLTYANFLLEKIGFEGF